MQDPALRRWYWLRLRRSIAANPDDPPIRPGDRAVIGAAHYQAGLADGDEENAALGLRQLLAAADQSIAPSGINREGSTSRQRQLTRLYLGAWLAARSKGRPEQWRLAAIARSLLAALQAITLPGGVPDIGATPDRKAPPDSAAVFSDDEQKALEELRRQARLDDLEMLRQDGWLRLDRGPWSGLWHCPPGGWPAKDGLCHQDLGAGEIHWRGLPLIVDPGSPPDGEPDSLFRSHAAHSGISLDKRDPYPLDRPVYSNAFRKDIAGAKPVLRGTADGVLIAFDGYGRFGGHRQIERHWRFQDGGLRIDDLILGTGRPLIERRLVTPWTVSRWEDGLLLERDGSRLRLTSDHPISLHPAQRRIDGGEEQALTLILMSGRANLPWRGSILLQPAV